MSAMATTFGRFMVTFRLSPRGGGGGFCVRIFLSRRPLQYETLLRGTKTAEDCLHNAHVSCFPDSCIFDDVICIGKARVGACVERLQVEARSTPFLAQSKPYISVAGFNTERKISPSGLFGA